MINLARVRQKAADIRDSLAAIRSLAAGTEDEFVANRTTVSAVKYELLVAMEAALDLCNHLCSRCLHKAPSAYAECFALLADGGIISEGTARRLMPMARFRNLLVHRYERIDNRRLYQIVHEHLPDLEQYLAELARYVGRDL